MNKIIPIGVCLSILSISSPLSARQSMITSPNEPTTKESELKNSQSSSETQIKQGGMQEKTDQTNGQMAAWMLESSRVAKDYVEGIDKGQYGQSWSKGDQLFQNIMSQNEWTKVLDVGRKNLGRVIDRKLAFQRPAWDPKGLPKGPYMVIEYETAFEKSPQSKELVTLRLGSDGKWRVLTYQVK